MKYILPLLVLLFALQHWDEPGDSVNQAETELKKKEAASQKNKTTEDYSELYFMHGIQISKQFCYLASPGVCEEGEVIESDTLHTSFLVRVGFKSETPDTVLLDGLEGANTKPREMVSAGFNGGAGAYPSCTGSSSNCGLVRKTGEQLEFDLHSPGGRYSGRGTLDNNMLKIQADYYYRGSGAEYILEGHKIVEEK